MFVQASVTTIATCPARTSSKPISRAICRAIRRASPHWLVSSMGIRTEAGILFPPQYRDAGAFARLRPDLEFVRKPFCSAQTQAHPVAGCVSFLQCQLNIGDTGSLIFEHQTDAR